MTGAGDRLDRRALNRAALARQLLLGRHELPVTAAVERLGGLNAQDPEPPCLSPLGPPGRVRPRRPDPGHGGPERGPGRAAAGHPAPGDRDRLPGLAPRLHPVLARSRQTFAQATGAGVNLAELAATARALLAERPLTRPELGRRLAERWPGSDRVALAWSARVLLPLVHPPPSGTWGSDRTRVTTDEHRRRVCVGAAVEPTVPLDGQVAAIWRLRREREPARAVLEIEPLDRLPAAARSAVIEEGGRLLTFAANDTPDHDLRFAAPGTLNRP
jgi:hypothetical protein